MTVQSNSTIRDISKTATTNIIIIAQISSLLMEMVEMEVETATTTTTAAAAATTTAATTTSIIIILEIPIKITIMTTISLETGKKTIIIQIKGKMMKIIKITVLSIIMTKINPMTMKISPDLNLIINTIIPCKCAMLNKIKILITNNPNNNSIIIKGIKCSNMLKRKKKISPKSQKEKSD